MYTLYVEDITMYNKVNKSIFMCIYEKAFINHRKSKTALLIRGYPWGMALPYTIKVEGGKALFNGKLD